MFIYLIIFVLQNTYSNFLFSTKSWKSVTKSYDVSMSHCLSLNLKASNKGKEIHIHEIQFVKLKWWKYLQKLNMPQQDWDTLLLLLELFWTPAQFLSFVEIAKIYMDKV